MTEVVLIEELIGISYDVFLADPWVFSVVCLNV